MLTLLLIIFSILGVLCFRKADWTDENDSHAWGFVGLAIANFVIIIFIVINLCDVVNSTVIDEKISMYQEENTEIENDISTMVKDYKQHELDVFDRSDTYSPTVLIQLYPELKSDTLVQNQMTVYTANNQKIKELKEKQINYKVSKWWLYFNL